MSLHALKLTLRNLAKNKVTNGINIIGLSVSMAAAILIIIWVQNELSFDSYHKDAGKIYEVRNLQKSPLWGDNLTEYSPYLMMDLAKKEIPNITNIAGFNMGWQNVFSINGEYYSEDHAAYVTADWFNLFHYDFVSGNSQAFNASPFNLIITESKAKKYFGTTDVIGKVIRKDTIALTVQGVIKDIPSNSSFQIDMLMPLNAYISNPQHRKNEESWSNFNYVTFVKLPNDGNVKSVEQTLTDIIAKNSGNKIETSLLPLGDLHFDSNAKYSKIEHGNKKTTYIFEVLAFLILVIACINYVNLTTAKAGTRVKEVSIKKIVGAGKKQLFFQFMFETLVICTIALFITLLLVYACLPFFDRLTEKHFILSPYSWTLWKILGGTLLVSILLNGIYPALLLSTFKPLNIFKGLNVLKVKDQSLRKGLVVTQFVISVFLVIGTFVIYSQLKFIQKQNSAYDHSQMFEVSIPWSTYFKNKKDNGISLQQSIKEALLSQTAIEGVSNVNGSIIDFRNTHGGSVDYDGRDSAYRPIVSPLSADEDLQKLLNLQVVEGRWFQKGLNDQDNFILNETAVKQFNIHKPIIGQRFSMHGNTGQIIGIVKDFYFRSMHEKVGPMVISNDPGYRSYFIIETKATDITAALAAGKKVWAQFVPGNPFDAKFFDQQFYTLYKEDQKSSMLIGIFASIAIIISCLGLFGLAVFTAEKRVKEIGIRKVLGASLKDITTLLTKEFVMLVLIGIIIASPLAWWAMNKWLDDFSYRINISWWFFAVAGIFALFIAICTISIQAIRAALANPAKSLRTE